MIGNLDTEYKRYGKCLVGKNLKNRIFSLNKKNIAAYKKKILEDLHSFTYRGFSPTFSKFLILAKLNPRSVVGK